MSFSGKVVIVTGASSGIGAASAKLFAKEEANVVIIGRNQEKLAGVTEEIAKIGKKPLVIVADISEDGNCEKIINETLNAYNRIDILINNAGFGRVASILSGKIMQAYDSIMATNLRAVINLTSLAAPHLIKTKGNIVNVSSVAAQTILSTDAICYCTSKAALNHFSRGAALELAAHGVRVNTVSPGPVDTYFNINAKIEKNLNEYAEYVPLKRIAQPEEIADIILYLASEKAKGVTGSDYVSDVGFLLTK